MRPVCKRTAVAWVGLRYFSDLPRFEDSTHDSPPTHPQAQAPLSSLIPKSPHSRPFAPAGL